MSPTDRRSDGRPDRPTACASDRPPDPSDRPPDPVVRPTARPLTGRPIARPTVRPPASTSPPRALRAARRLGLVARLEVTYAWSPDRARRRLHRMTACKHDGGSTHKRLRVRRSIWLGVDEQNDDAGIDRGASVAQQRRIRSIFPAGATLLPSQVPALVTAPPTKDREASNDWSADNTHIQGPGWIRHGFDFVSAHRSHECGRTRSFQIERGLLGGELVGRSARSRRLSGRSFHIVILPKGLSLVRRRISSRTPSAAPHAVSEWMHG